MRTGKYSWIKWLFISLTIMVEHLTHCFVCAKKFISRADQICQNFKRSHHSNIYARSCIALLLLHVAQMRPGNLLLRHNTASIKKSLLTVLQNCFRFYYVLANFTRSRNIWSRFRTFQSRKGAFTYQSWCLDICPKNDVILFPEKVFVL